MKKDSSVVDASDSAELSNTLTSGVAVTESQPQLSDLSASVDTLASTNTKNQKKKQNKKKNKKNKELLKEWRTRYLSPEHAEKMGLESQADLNIINLNPNAKLKVKEFLSDEEESSSNDENSDEEFEDFHKDGYHPAHIK